jgi:hypothetical protein
VAPRTNRPGLAGGALGEDLGPDVGMYNVLYASAPQASDGSFPDHCLLMLYRPTDVTGEEFGWAIREKYSEHITVEATPGGVVRVPLMGDNPWPDFVDEYAIAGGDTVAVLHCFGHARDHDGRMRDYDHWLPIAEPTEFLPAEE